METAAGLGARGSARTILHALRRILDDVVLVGGDMLALLPDRRAHGAVRADRVARPVTARVVEGEATREGPGHDLAGELFRETQSEFFPRLVVAGANVQQGESGP